MAETKLFSPGDVAMRGETGTWALALASNVFTFSHSDADDTSVVAIPIPRYNGGKTWRNSPSIIKVTYTVVTAALGGAPTAVLDKMSWSSSTGVTTRAAVTQTLTFGGVDAVGTAAGAGAAGTHIAIVTVTTPENLTDADYYILELTLNAEGTTVLKIQNFEVTYV